MAGPKTEDILRYLEANHSDAFRDAIEYARKCGSSPNSPEAGPSAEAEPMFSDGPSDPEVAPSEHPAKASEGTRVPRSPRSPQL